MIQSDTALDTSARCRPISRGHCFNSNANVVRLHEKLRSEREARAEDAVRYEAMIEQLHTQLQENAQAKRRKVAKYEAEVDEPIPYEIEFDNIHNENESLDIGNFEDLSSYLSLDDSRTSTEIPKSTHSEVKMESKYTNSKDEIDDDLYLTIINDTEMEDMERELNEHVRVFEEITENLINKKAKRVCLIEDNWDQIEAQMEEIRSIDGTPQPTVSGKIRDFLHNTEQWENRFTNAYFEFCDASEKFAMERLRSKLYNKGVSPKKIEKVTGVENWGYLTK